MDGHGRPGGARLLELRETAPGLYEARLEIGGRIVTVQARLVGDVLETPYGSYHLASLRRSAAHRGQWARGRRGDWLVSVDESGAIRARLPVKVVEARVRAGDRVTEGQVIALLETMKMVNEVHAPCHGVVEEIAEAGQGVDRGGVVARIRCEERG